MSVRQLVKFYSIVLLTVLLLAIFTMLSLITFVTNVDVNFLYNKISELLADNNFLLYILVGFIAQMIDGSLGMAYGVSSSTFLLSIGVSPAVASASVHTAEIFTTGISGWSHLKFKNVNKKLLYLIALPGAIGAIIGALLLSYFDGNILKPFIAIYLLFMGIRIIFKAFNKKVKKNSFKQYSLLGFFGGFLDASGGGGWGPVVTTTLIGTGRNPTITIGTVNTAEFIVTLASSLVFVATLSFSYWHVILGLIIGGIFAAPLAAYTCHKINVKWALILVGTIIILLSLRTIIKIF
ncbi:MAG: sulfite exporter TauE/SafE family protein [Bacteroidales bacterium]|nr:sulfite exporter TauE/SafE family protein [Bacteroidales bacterium]